MSRSRGNKPQQSQESSQSPQQTDDGWTTKKTRQKKRNLQRPKGPKPVNPPKNKRKRNQRRKKNKQNQLLSESQNGFNQRMDEKQQEIDSVIIEIEKCCPELSDKNILQTVVQEMNLKTFNPNDTKLKADVLECIRRLKMEQLNQQFMNDQNHDIINNQQQQQQQQEMDDQNINTQKINEKQQQQQQQHDDNEQNEEEEEEEEEEDEEEQDEDEQNEEESMEQKESSESPQKPDSRSGGDDDKKSSISSQRDEPQRMKKTKKKKRKRRRGRKQQQHQEQDEEEEDDDDDDDDEQDDISQNEENDELSANESSTKSRSPSQPQKSAKQQQGKKKKITLNDKLKNMNLRNITSSRQQFLEWINLLRDNDKFLNSFISSNGLSHIICKMILDLGSNGDINIFSKYSVDIINLFDILLCGTHSYHEWLYSELMALSGKLQTMTLSDRSPNNLQCIICEQVAHLIDAQLLRHDDSQNDNNSDNSDEIKRDSSFSKPSCLLHGGHKERDPIVPAFNALDRDLLSLSDLYHNLVLHDNRIKLSCPTSSDSFIASYDSIKQELSCSIQLISVKSRGLEQELFAMKNEQSSISRQENEELIPLKQNLSNQENEKYRLQQEKIRIENELVTISRNLSKTDMFIEQTKCQMADIENSYKPQCDKLFESMSDHQFEIAGYAQESQCHNYLLSITNKSYHSLSIWSNNEMAVDTESRHKLENSYINCLAHYLCDLVTAERMVIDRVEQLKENIESFRRTNETTNKYYAQSFNIDQQLNKYKKHIIIDEKTIKNIHQDIYKNIDKAKKIVSPQLFDKFINHIQKQEIAKLCDLNKYQIHSSSNNNISTQTVSTQNISDQQQQQQTTTTTTKRGSKPPITKSNILSQQQQQQKQSNNIQNIRGTKPPQRHYNINQNMNNQNNQNNQNNMNQQQRGKRRPPQRNQTMYSYHQ